MQKKSDNILKFLSFNICILQITFIENFKNYMKSEVSGKSST